MSIDEQFSKVPHGLESPVDLGCGKYQFEVWKGNTTLFQGKMVTRGEARVFLNLMPIPEFLFELTPEEQPSLKDMFLGRDLTDGHMECGPRLGTLSCLVTKAGATISGYVMEQECGDCEKTLYTSAKFVVLNGPFVYGTPIVRGESSFTGRSTVRVDDVEVILDLLSSKKQSRESVYEPTHVAYSTFSEPVSIKRIDELRTTLFRCLSLMKCRWVGVLGPWLETVDGTGVNFNVAVTKTERNGGTISWCDQMMRECFGELFPAIVAAFSDDIRTDALKTAFQWLVESEQCAGGVEGAVILQQAALESLAWLEVVGVRRICSESGFKSLQASDKIRWLLSLNNITPEIPSHCVTTRSYAKEYNLKDLIDVLVDVRNACVHAEPKKASRLFARSAGNEERSEIWYQIGGLLHQAFLASIGYHGKMSRRDLDVEFTAHTIKDVPWAKGGSKV